MSKPITIVGGGLAGLTLGIGLRRMGVPAAILEAGEYPRHRVCGEFISGRGLEILRGLGMERELELAGAVRAETVLFVAGTNRSPVRKLPRNALCVSRHELDHLLAREFERSGGDLRIRTRRPGEAGGEGVVRATGRRPHPTEGGWKWFGLKAHVRGAKPAADLVMHMSSRGYVGVNRVNPEETNVCGLFRSVPGDAPAGPEWLKGEPDSPLRKTLAGAEWIEGSFCAVAGISLRPRSARNLDECCIGDAVTMIPPVTGNGMSMAIESAEIAGDPLAAWSRGELSWSDARRQVAERCDGAFKRRLLWARVLQWLMFSPLLDRKIGSAALASDFLWNLFFAKTR